MREVSVCLAGSMRTTGRMGVRRTRRLRVLGVLRARRLHALDLLAAQAVVDCGVQM